ncbi:MAG TPA: DUF448 domain-containing protein [Clostridiales bacterium]|nr:DUF448 domain-containing protein [Clostridiales bacterium]
MKSNKQPTRTCIACKQQNDKKNLLRIVKTEDGAVLDKTGKSNGRGAYICNDIKCIEKCIKSKALNRAFSTNIQPNVYEKLKEDFLAGNNQ